MRLRKAATLCLIATIASLAVCTYTFVTSRSTTSSQLPLSTTGQGRSAFVFHESIITTTFWVGEAANSDNGYIANTSSTWDQAWEQHFGGLDDPTHRNNFAPAGFIPKENSFYVALPYSDVDSNDNRKTNATSCPLSSILKMQHISWCKNSWIAVHHNGKVAYAQWEDAGPFGENDAAYVFGAAQPRNTTGEHAGLDVSPAIHDYLGLQDVDRCDWSFVASATVPSGPWKQIITTTPSGYVN